MIKIGVSGWKRGNDVRPRSVKACGIGIAGPNQVLFGVIHNTPCPGSFLFWFSIHPFIQFWRKVGPWLTLAIHYALMLILAAGVFLVRTPNGDRCTWLNANARVPVEE